MTAQWLPCSLIPALLSNLAHRTIHYLPFTIPNHRFSRALDSLTLDFGLRTLDSPLITARSLSSPCLPVSLSPFRRLSAAPLSLPRRVHSFANHPINAALLASADAPNPDLLALRRFEWVTDH